MQIVVVLKRVPDTDTRVRVAEDGFSLDPGGVRYVTNPYDEFALEAALRIREERGEGEITAITLGEESAQEMLRGALAAGADRAILLRGRAGSDGSAVARALLPEVEALGPDLVLFGMKTIDDDQEQLGPMLATMLRLPCATAVSEFEIEGSHLRCRREVEGAREWVQLPLPAALTITKGAYEPRHPSLKGIMAAKKKPLDVRDVIVPPGRMRVVEMRLPPERQGAKFIGEGPDAVPELVRRLRGEAGVL